MNLKWFVVILFGLLLWYPFVDETVLRYSDCSVKMYFCIKLVQGLQTKSISQVSVLHHTHSCRVKHCNQLAICEGEREVCIATQNTVFKVFKSQSH